MRTEELDFDLPADLIAQTPSARRGESRLLHYRRDNHAIVHRSFGDLPKVLRAGDALVFNDTRVIPARFSLVKDTGGRVEGLFISEMVEETSGTRWTVMLRNLGRCRSLVFEADGAISARVLSVNDGGICTMQIEPPIAATQLLSRVGRMPLPPYIHRDKLRDARDEEDRQRYQTVYAQAGNSVAAPTAGLHFTDELLGELDRIGVERVTVTLDVGIGTFKPVQAEELDHHVMHRETYQISPEAAAQLNDAKDAGRRIIAVGTTAARVLESQSDEKAIEAHAGSTDIFIRPPYRWKLVDALITNFHLPRSTLIALVAAMTGIEEQRRIYSIAIGEGYRFFSYGDAMLIE